MGSTFLNSESSAPGQPVIRTHLSGYNLLMSPRLNKGTAFTEAERDTFALHGLLPPHVGTIENQRERRKRVLDSHPTAFDKYAYMRDLQDNNETLFYSLIANYIEEMLPVVYTPAVGEGCQRFSEIWRKPRGLFLSYPDKDRIEQIFSSSHYDPIRCIVVSDGERILGLGDQGAGGMGIPIGKMALYTALGGIPPEHCLPVLLDVGTDNEARLNDPIYIGWEHKRVRGQEYDDFIEAFVAAVERRWPHILLQWEDFAGVNASRLLERYRDRLCTFNDDIQGTAAVTTATLLAAVNATGIPLREHTIAMFGTGSAGAGILDLLIAEMKQEGLSDEQARRRIYAFNHLGLLVEGCEGIRPAQQPFVRKREDVAGWKLSGTGAISLLDVVRNAGITVLAGVSAQPGAFTEEIVREMARHTPHPVIFPLSNPTSQSEAAPADLLRWTEGRAIVGTGSPFAPVEDQRETCSHRAGQQLLHFSWPLSRHSCLSRNARYRRHDYGRRKSAGCAFASARRQECTAAAADRRVPQDKRGGRVGRWSAGDGRRSGPSRAMKPPSLKEFAIMCGSRSMCNMSAR